LAHGVRALRWPILLARRAAIITIPLIVEEVATTGGAHSTDKLLHAAPRLGILDASPELLRLSMSDYNVWLAP
jgi:hypothetical protein